MSSHGTLGAAAGALIALLGACSSGSTAPSDVGPAQLLLVKPAAATLQGGQSLKLAVLVQDASEFTPAPAGVVWSSSDAAVASVAPEGLVQAGQQGTADIVAYWNGMRGVARMTVLSGEAPESPCPSLSVARAGSSLKEATECKGSTERPRP
jgi:hypothetical protein